LKEWLFAKFPDHPPESYFDYKEVLWTMQIIFAYHDDEPGVGVPRASTRRCDTPPPPKAHEHDTWAPDRSRRTSRHKQDRDTPYYEHAEHEEDFDSGASDDFDSEDEAPRCSVQKIETKTICFKNCPCKNEDWELEELVGSCTGWTSGIVPMRQGMLALPIISLMPPEMCPSLSTSRQLWPPPPSSNKSHCRHLHQHTLIKP
jgi:hypothetical protein